MSNILKNTFVPYLKNIFSIAFILSLTPIIAHAATFDSLIDDMVWVLLMFIPVVMGLAVLVFFWGLVKFINHAGDEKTLADGKQLMFWGMLAIFVMVTLWSIVGYFQQELGLDTAIDLGTLPAQPDTLPF